MQMGGNNWFSGFRNSFSAIMKSRFLSLLVLASSIWLGHAAGVADQTVIVDDKDAVKNGDWKESTWSRERHGDSYLHDDRKGKGEKSVTFVPRLKESGEYEVRISYSAVTGRANNVPITIRRGDVKTEVKLDQSNPPKIRNLWQPVGRFRFERDADNAVVISTAGTIGHVIADAVAFVPLAIADRDLKAHSELVVVKPEVIREFSGIYPHLASFNEHGECGTGALVPWANRLWFVSYAPHMPRGGSDKLYSVHPDLTLNIHPESIGGTPANRMIHRESQQLFIGPYAIGATGAVRTIPYTKMFGRPTGNARHLFDPAGKIYYASMEEGIYEVDVKTLEVTELWRDEALGGGRKAGLPGYHGKGLYSGQGRLIYANNGEHGREAQTRPDVPSGVLAEWDGRAEALNIVLRNQFTEVTGPGGIHGSANPATDPIWSVGWDHRSLILMTLFKGKWHRYRLPKASHSYDGAHGWNTEWPRIREIGEGDNLLMTMHGMFWRFPKGFRPGNTGGIAPRSTYLKVIGDFCRWNDKVVFGCDDTAQNEFLNTRRAKGRVSGPARSQSNLWFVTPDRIDRLGPTSGRGAVWLEDAVKAGETSDAFLVNGFARKSVHVVHDSGANVGFAFEVDERGDGKWRRVLNHSAPNGYSWLKLPKGMDAAWVRVTSDTDCRATVWFELRNEDSRKAVSGSQFASLAPMDAKEIQFGLIRAGLPEQGLQLLATTAQGKEEQVTGYYELSPQLKLERVDDTAQMKWMQENVAIPRRVLKMERSSVLYVADNGKRFRLPIGNPAYVGDPRLQRVSREVATERDLFQAAGTFFELPARNAGGFGRIRPIATHRFFIKDYCSWRGLMVLTGISPNAAKDNQRVIRSEDGRASVWLGAIDDLWQLGKPVGRGGPWDQTSVTKGEASDPFLMRGYAQKSVAISHDSGNAVGFELQVDITGTGNWQTYGRYSVKTKEELKHDFPTAFEAYWVRAKVAADCRATVMFEYQ